MNINVYNSRNKLALRAILTSLFFLFFFVSVGSAKMPPDGFADLVEKLGPTVVNIYSTQTVKTQNLPQQYFYGNENLPELFRHFFDFPQQQRQAPHSMPDQKRTSLGSGVIISSDGFIITNNHVIEDADKIHVKTANYEEYEATIIGRDPKTDLALVKIEPQHDLPVAHFGNSDELRVGDWVIAIGNPFGFEQTVTAGIVSGKSRAISDGPYQNFIQTDASINPGNSGGPLFNMNGELMGINSAIYSRSGGNIGLGFAIPANMAKSIVNQIQTTGKVTRGMLGVMIQTVTPDLAKEFGLQRTIGALVGRVMKDSPAEKAGIETGDIIVSYQGKEIAQSSMLPSLVSQTPVGTKAEVVVFRDGGEKKITVTIGELPEDQVAGTEMQQEGLSVQQELGLTVQTLTKDLAESMGLEVSSGVIISDVARGSLAESAGLLQGDVILEVGTGGKRYRIDTLEDFQKTMKEMGDEKSILFLVKTKNQNRFVLLKRP